MRVEREFERERARMKEKINQIEKVEEKMSKLVINV